MEEFFSDIAHRFDSGGIWMWPILACLIVALTLIVERGIVLFRAAINKEQFVLSLQKLIFQGQVDKAIQQCSQTPKPLAQIIKAGLLKVRGTDEEVQAAMDQAALRELPRLEKRTAYLGMIGNIATLLGLLGTILGLIKCFASVAGVGAAEKATLLAEGISEAMNCTAFGIFSAIIALIGFAIYQGKTQALLDDINESTVRVLNLVVENRDKMKLQAN
jgi:biopolymer transport protein ExbB/TolQ